MHMLSFGLMAQSAAENGNNTGLGFIAWIVVGLVAGFLGSKIVNKRGDGLIVDILLGLVGGVLGGFLCSLIGIHAGGSLILSIVVATVGSVVFLLIYQKLIKAV